MLHLASGSQLVSALKPSRQNILLPFANILVFNKKKEAFLAPYSKLLSRFPYSQGSRVS